ncbi:hypothetical protein SAY86_026617 [Trapa natans]|uniref:Uncharacterized protein n=1 Tax=Trapa natans TaxID=22666 RepID=A0AAN7K9Y4_TRANT|nr:hypothetical protein SAY86_025908 [Trapa natans]KAK4765527.1 hypothetical protein SAY86_026617 [Trapa natans]
MGSDSLVVAVAPLLIRRRRHICLLFQFRMSFATESLIASIPATGCEDGGCSWSLVGDEDGLTKSEVFMIGGGEEAMNHKWTCWRFYVWVNCYKYSPIKKKKEIEVSLARKSRHMHI